jgi:hypothetical protein
MATHVKDDELDDGRNSGSRPVPDPTVLTTQQLLRELEGLKEFVFTRLEPAHCPADSRRQSAWRASGDRRNAAAASASGEFYSLPAWQEYRKYVADRVRDCGADYVQASDWITNPSEFSDPLHMTKAGATEFSRRLATTIHPR